MSGEAQMNVAYSVCRTVPLTLHKLHKSSDWCLNRKLLYLLSARLLNINFKFRDIRPYLRVSDFFCSSCFICPFRAELKGCVCPWTVFLYFFIEHSGNFFSGQHSWKREGKILIQKTSVWITWIIVNNLITLNNLALQCSHEIDFQANNRTMEFEPST